MIIIKVIKMILIIIVITIRIIVIIIIIIPPRPGDSLISWGEGFSLALVGNPSRDGV